MNESIPNHNFALIVDEKTEMFYFRANIIKIITDEKTAYPAWTSCKKKIYQDICDWNWKCDNCNIKFKIPEYEYNLKFYASNGLKNGALWMIAFK